MVLLGSKLEVGKGKRRQGRVFRGCVLSRSLADHSRSRRQRREQRAEIAAPMSPAVLSPPPSLALSTYDIQSTDCRCPPLLHSALLPGHERIECQGRHAHPSVRVPPCSGTHTLANTHLHTHLHTHLPHRQCCALQRPVGAQYWLKRGGGLCSQMTCSAPSLCVLAI